MVYRIRIVALTMVLAWCGMAAGETSLSKKDSKNFLEGLTAYQEGKWKTVAKKLSPYLTKPNPLPDYALFAVAVAERHTKKCAKATPRFSKLRETYPQSIYVDKSYLEEAKALLCSKGYVKARERLKEYMRMHPPDHLEEESRLLIGKSYFLAGEKETATQKLKEFWAETPESDLAQEAEKFLVKMKVAPTHQEKWRRARLLYKLRDWGATKNLLVELGAQDSYLFAECIFRLKDYARAKKLFENLIHRGEDSQKALARLATVNARMGDYDAAIRHNLSISRKFPGSRSQRTALKKIAFLHKDRFDFEKSAEVLQNLLQKKLSRKEKIKVLEELAWVTYRGGNLEGALETLKQISANKRLKKKERAKYLFWKGKILAKQAGEKDLEKEVKKEKKKLSREAFREAWIKDRWSYYGLSSFRELHKKDKDFYAALKTEDERRARRIRRVALDPEPSTEGFFHLPRADALHSLGLKRLAAREMKAAYKEAKGSTTLLKRTGEIAFAVGNYYIPMVIGLKIPGLLDKPGEIWKWVYPEAYSSIVKRHAEHRGLDSRFIYSIMRQESAFQEEVVSSAGARGLIQIMPYTGRRLARTMGWEGYRTQDLFEPEINIALSALYLQMNSDLFENRLPMVIASYNAGEAAVARWLPSRRNLEDWEFIEEIPYRETNKYVKKVLGNYWMYQYLYPDAKRDKKEAKKTKKTKKT